MTAEDFKYGDWKLYDAIDALVIYTNSFVEKISAEEKQEKDDLQEAVYTFLQQLDEEDSRVILATYAAKYVSPEGIENGYGLLDILGFTDYLSRHGLI